MAREKQNGRLFVFELNEFNRDVLAQGAGELGLENLKRLLFLKESVTATKDTYDSNWLEPWVQWVSVHTGKTSEQHRVKHLGDVPDLSSPQIWEALSEQGVSSGVWGALNASRGKADLCRVFLPDPWTFSEQAFPPELNSFLDFPRYIAKNRVKFSWFELARVMSRYMGNFLAPTMLIELLKALPSYVFVAARFPMSAFHGFCLAEYLSALFFLRRWRRHEFRCAFLFVNSLAHVQHYYWNKEAGVRGSPQIAYCLKLLDRLLEKIFANLEPGDHFIALNALSQMNTNHEQDWILYRPIDQPSFLRGAGIDFDRVEALMTYDAIAFFKSFEARETARKILDSLTVQGKKLFLTETYAGDPLRLFYRVDFFDPLSESASFRFNGKEAPFFSRFKRIVRRTGKHVPRGSLFSSLETVPEMIENHELYGLVAGYFEARR